MSRKAFKTSLKSEFDQKIPNVLSKIDLENIHIKEKETATSRFRRPVFRLVTSLSLAVVVIITVLAITLNRGGNTGPLVATKQDEAMMTSVISAYQLVHTTTTANIANITLSSNDNDDEGPNLDPNNFFNEITSEIDEFFSGIETILFADDKADLQQDEDDDSSFKLSAKSSHLSGWQSSYDVKYTITENEDGTKTVQGSLLIDNRMVSQFTGTVTETSGNEVITIYYDDITVVTWVENEGTDNEVTIYNISRLNKSGLTVIKEYVENDKRVIELLPSPKILSSLYQKAYKFITSEADGKDTVEVILTTESTMFQISSETRMIITASETAEYIEYTYDFKGNITILGILQPFEFSITIKHRKD
ncbi:MAG: hypothetical protein ACOX56_03465 [Acholeplasmataceae bacterium]